MYQLLDSGFIGLIFSCFSEDAHKVCLLCSYMACRKHLNESLHLFSEFLAFPFNSFLGWKNSGYCISVLGWKTESCFEICSSVPCT